MRARNEPDPWQSSTAPVDSAPLPPPVPVQTTPPPPPPPPPPPHHVANPPGVTGTGEIVVRVRDSNGGEVGRVEVWLYDRNGKREQQVAPSGTLRFRRLPADRYRLRITLTPATPQSPMNQQVRIVDLADGQREVVNIMIPPPRPVRDPDFDRGPCCKPYGAPPARRRVV
ncbi:MAG TPA: carboxypeptidase-like regulatory domain-containing protein [Kofleriaceae bacterium]